MAIVEARKPFRRTSYLEVYIHSDTEGRGPTAHNSRVGAITLNRIAILLAFAGTFIAGVLSLGHLLNVSVPCGVDRGCDQVSSHPTAYWNETPVAYFGVAAYLALALIGTLRALVGVGSSRWLVWPALLVSGVGAGLSFWLQYQSLTVIKAFCPWCFASAVVMAFSFVVQTLLYVKSADRPARSKRDPAFVFGCATLAALGIAAQAYSLTAQVDQTVAVRDMAPLLTKDSIRLGPDTAPVRIVEFSDLLCDSCRKYTPELEKLVERSKGRVQLIFRHFPLYKKASHEMALPGAFVAEVAAEQGKEWEFIHAFSEVDQYEMFRIEDVMVVAKRVGLDVVKLKARMKETDPAFSRVYRDLGYGSEIGITVTPTFVVVAEGLPLRGARGGDVFKLLSQPEYQKLINGS